MNFRPLVFGAAAAAILAVGIAVRQSWQRSQAVADDLRPKAVAVPGGSLEEARAIILAPVEDAGGLAEQFSATQQKLRIQPDDAGSLEKLGRLFVTQARLSFDPGYYTLAEQCARLLAEKNPQSPQALLLQGHALLAMHRFREAEVVARRLVPLRGEVLEYALLGDALLEQGRLEEAVAAYQSMIDAKPCLPSYSRVAHLRWLKGDLDGAIEVIRQAAATGSYRDPEPLAWVTARLALYQLQQGDLVQALQSVERATQLVPDYPPALLVRGRVLLAQDQPAEAVAALRPAAAKNPLPEYEWALADALRAAGNDAEAERVEQALEKTGAARDPRTFALYLATRRLRPAEALALATAELESRRDAATHDTLAWAQHAARQLPEARTTIAQALAAGLPDARLFLHAAVIAQASGETAEARGLFEKARALRRMLLPSEQSELERGVTALGSAQPRSSQP
jgi:tetratricopeptide (TPR) repeat protein